MTWLKQNWFKIGLLIILAIFVAGIYWYEWRQSEIKEWTGETFLKDEQIGDINNFPKFSNEQDCLNWGNNQKKINKVDSFKCGLNCGELFDERDTYFLCDSEVDI